MAYTFINKGNAWNIYCSIVDAPLFDRAITLDKLTDWVREEQGQLGIDALPSRLDRSRKKVTSSMVIGSLEDDISCNRAGPDESRLSPEEFVRLFLSA